MKIIPRIGNTFSKNKVTGCKCIMVGNGISYLPDV